MARQPMLNAAECNRTTGCSRKSSRVTTPKVADAAADRPVQVLVFAVSDFAHITVSRHEVRADQVVARRPVQASPVRVTAREREARNACGAAQSHRCVKTRGQRGFEKLPDPGTPTHRGDSVVAVDANGAEGPKVYL
jgi:hypothetical protein